MNKALATRENLLTQARRLLWSKGYSNVSLRQIAQGAGVDVALVSRYFGSKRGLFEATMDGAFDTPPVSDTEELITIVVELFKTAPRDGLEPSVLQLMMMNAHDPEVGEMVRTAQRDGMQGRLEQLIGDPTRAALFLAAILGFSVAEKSLHLNGIAAPDSAEYEAQLRHTLRAALAFKA